MTRAVEPAATGYAAEITRLLWPAPWSAPHVTRRHGPPDVICHDAYIFPGTRRPRLLLPVDVPAAVTMLHRLGKGRSPLARPVRGVLARSVRSPAFTLTRWPVMRVVLSSDKTADSVESYLATCLGVPVRVGVVLGTRRPNQKPVLQIFALDGRLLGYAKIGHNRLTAPLVAREAAELSVLNQHRTTSFRTPRLLHSGHWRTLEVLVMSPLSGTPGLHTPEARRVAAMREVALLNGTMTRPLTQSSFWARLESQTDQLPDGPVRKRLLTALSRIRVGWGAAEIELGGWHGDWGHWNTALDDGVVQLWDWERYDAAVPLGFDALHHRAQRVRPGDRDFAQQEKAFLQESPGILAAFDVPAERTELTVVLYLAEIAIRYAHASSHAVTPALERRAAWSLALLESLAGNPSPHQPGGDQ